MNPQTDLVFREILIDLKMRAPTIYKRFGDLPIAAQIEIRDMVLSSVLPWRYNVLHGQAALAIARQEDLQLRRTRSRVQAPSNPRRSAARGGASMKTAINFQELVEEKKRILRGILERKGIDSLIDNSAIGFAIQQLREDAAEVIIRESTKALEADRRARSSIPYVSAKTVEAWMRDFERYGFDVPQAFMRLMQSNPQLFGWLESLKHAALADKDQAIVSSLPIVLMLYELLQRQVETDQLNTSLKPPDQPATS